VRRLVHERRIPYIKWGHLLRFDPSEIAAWIDTHRNRPTAR
jgi:excisionase family DNA binding protein